MVYQMFNAMNLVYNQQRICKIWIGLKPIVILFTPETVEVIEFNLYVKQPLDNSWLTYDYGVVDCQVILSSNTLTDKSDEYKFLEPWLGECRRCDLKLTCSQ